MNSHLDDPIISPSQIETISVYEISNENGVFPTGYKDEILLSIPDVQLYHSQPQDSHDTLDETLIANGELILRDPAPGTPLNVTLIGECNGMMFYVTNEDSVIRISSRIFTLLFPQDCIVIYLSERIPKEDLGHLEALLTVRTKTHEDPKPTIAERQRCELVPDNKYSQNMYQISLLIANKIVSASESGAKYISKYGEKKRENLKETNETKVSPTSVEVANTVKKTSKITLQTIDKISSSISHKAGKAISSSIEIKQDDSKWKRVGKKVFVTSALAVSEIVDGTAEGLGLLSNAAKKESISYISDKYGKDAGDLARNTFGATFYFGRAALSARRVLNVKKMLEASATEAVKASIQKTEESKQKL